MTKGRTPHILDQIVLLSQEISPKNASKSKSYIWLTKKMLELLKLELKISFLDCMRNLRPLNLIAMPTF